MRAIGAARSENGPVAEIGAAIDQCVVSVRDALEEHLDVEFVAITREQQEAPIAIAERKGKYRSLVEANLDRLLGRQRAQTPAPRREAAKVPCRTDRRPRLHCAYRQTLTYACPGNAAGHTIKHQGWLVAAVDHDRLHGWINFPKQDADNVPVLPRIGCSPIRGIDATNANTRRSGSRRQVTRQFYFYWYFLIYVTKRALAVLVSG